MSTERTDIAELISMQLDLPTTITEDAADVIIAAGYRKPRVIKTFEELAALHEYAVICYHDEDGANYPITVRDALLDCSGYLPATVLHEPK